MPQGCARQPSDIPQMSDEEAIIYLSKLKREKFENLQSLISKQIKTTKLIAQKTHNIEITEIFEEEPLP